MIEIKFKAKRVDCDEWVFGDLMQTDKDTFIVSHNSETHDELPCKDKEYWAEWDKVIPETVSQFTGLKDKNGVEIYENDTVLDLDYNIEYTCIFENGMFCFRSKDNRGFDFNEHGIKDVIELISNIHDKK